MYNYYNTYPYYANQHYINQSMYNPYNMYNDYRTYPYPYSGNPPMYNPNYPNRLIKLMDYGPEPFVINIDQATKQNNTFRTALWTGKHLQVTLMSIPVGESIGLEIHPHLDQFIRIEEGEGLVQMGEEKDCLDFQARVCDDFAFIIPACTWHNLVNTGCKPIKLYSIYAPPQHPKGTVHVTKADAEAAEQNRGYYYENDQCSLRQTREFTLSQLAQYDGTMGKPAYVAVNGIVYDVSNVSKWSGGTHHGLTAGKDLSSQFQGCHGDISRLAKLPKVGILKVQV